MIPGLILRQLRESKKISQKDLAQILNVSASSVTMWETGKREICQKELIAISKYFDVSTDYILGLKYKDIDLAFYNQLGELNELQKIDIIKYAEFIRSKSEVTG